MRNTAFVISKLVSMIAPDFGQLRVLLLRPFPKVLDLLRQLRKNKNAN